MQTHITKDAVRNPYHDDKIFWPYHAFRSLAILRGEIPPPSLIEIDPTDGGCNQACIPCCFGSSPLRRLNLIDIGELLDFVAEAYECGTLAYELVGGGEPTNHPGIAKIIQGVASIAKPGSERPHIGMVTNGVLLDRIFRVAEHLDFIRISLDAPDTVLYNSLHGLTQGSNHFERVIKNVRSLVDIVGGKSVRIGYLVVPPYNNHSDEIFRTVDLAHDLGVEHIAFRPAFSDKPIPTDAWREASSAITEAKLKYRDGFVLGGVGGSWEFALGNKTQPSGHCRTRPLVLVIKADGTIPSCFLYRERLEERAPIGKIIDGFRNVWFSERHKESLLKVERLTCPKFCKLYRAETALEHLDEIVSSEGTIPVLGDSEIDNPHFI